MSDLLEQRLLKNILVVEDDDAQRQTLCDILRQEGFDPIGCATASEALESARTSSVAVAIVDLRLPDRNGIEVTRELVDVLHGARVIIHTAYGSFESARDALNLGAFAYVEKLSDPRELLSHVHRAIEEVLDTAIREGGEDLRMLTEHVPDVVLQVDRAGRILFANRAFTGYTVDDMDGQPMREWIVPDHQPAIDAAVGEVFEAYRPQECEVMVEARDGARNWYACRIGPIGTPGNVERAIVIARDVTEARQAQQIENVMLQLFRNAREATLAGGSLTVEIGTVVLDAEQAAAHPGARPGPHVMISVDDDGPGIPAEHFDRIFEPFFTTRPGRNKGLGLTEVYGIVAQAGGHLAVESEPGRGTSVKVFLPTGSRVPAASDENPGSPAPGKPGSGGPDPDRANVIYRFPRQGSEE